MMRTFVLLMAASVACFGQAKSAWESDPTGWTDIMPAASMKGWTRAPFMSTLPLSEVSQWKVNAADKVLVCEGDGGHEWLRYDKPLKDIILHAEFRFTPVEGKTGYNSGVMVRNSEDGKIYHQAQAGPEGTGWLFANTPVNGTPQRINLRSQMKENRVKPVGEWNVYEVRAVGDKITLWVNGAVTSEMTGIEAKEGYLGLEAEGFRIEFRNLKLKTVSVD